MKQIFIYVIIVSTWLAFSCGGNKLKSNEKTLGQQILTEEEQLAYEAEFRAVTEKQLADSLAKLPKGYRIPENRHIDPEHPPVIIDISGYRTNPQKIKLSQLFTKIDYILLEPVPDSSFYKQGNTGFLANDNFLYGCSANGIVQYNNEGKFIKYICKNDYHYTQINGYEMVTEQDWSMFKGSSQPGLLNNKLFYRYENRAAGIALLMKYDEHSDDVRMSLPTPETKNDEISRLGVTVAKLAVRKNALMRPEFVPLGNLFVGNILIRKSLNGLKNFLSVTNNKGDTICTFEDKDPIRNFSKSVYRGVDSGNSYLFNGRLNLRQAYNDTIYQLIPPNRLVPKYVFDFGNLGIKSASEGIDPGFSLKDKMVFHSLLETDHYLFITYTKDYECSNTAKNGTLKYSRLIYNKKSKILTPLYLDEPPFISEGNLTSPSAPDANVENDLDSMPFRWPKFVTAKGEPFSKISGNELLKIKNKDLPVKNFSKNDWIIAIYH